MKLIFATAVLCAVSTDAACWSRAEYRTIGEWQSIPCIRPAGYMCQCRNGRWNPVPRTGGNGGISAYVSNSRKLSSNADAEPATDSTRKLYPTLSQRNANARQAALRNVEQKALSSLQSEVRSGRATGGYTRGHLNGISGTHSVHGLSRGGSYGTFQPDYYRKLATDSTRKLYPGSYRNTESNHYNTGRFFSSGCYNTADGGRVCQ